MLYPIALVKPEGDSMFCNKRAHQLNALCSATRLSQKSDSFVSLLKLVCIENLVLVLQGFT